MKDPDLIQEWLTKARHDLDTARVISAQLPDYYDMIAFHCQQSIELITYNKRRINVRLLDLLLINQLQKVWTWKYISHAFGNLSAKVRQARAEIMRGKIR